MRIVVDSWAWVEILRLSGAGKAAKAEIERAEAVFTPAIVLAELARKRFREGIDERTVGRWLHEISEATEVYGIDIGLAMESAKAFGELVDKARKEKLGRPGLGDALVLATARAVGAKLLSGDPHFRGLQETLWLEN